MVSTTSSSLALPASEGLTQKILDELKGLRISHIVWLPHSENKDMFEAIRHEPQITLVPVCREGEALAIAAGLWLGGKNPVVMHQSTGFFEAGDSVRGLALDLQLPLLLLIGARGWRPASGGPPEDSAAIYLEPILDAWGIKHHLVSHEGEVKKISQAYAEAQKTSRPVAALIAKE